MTDGEGDERFEVNGRDDGFLGWGLCIARETLRLAAQLRERDEMIKELESNLKIACDEQAAHWMVMHSEERTRAESAERELAEAEEAIKKTPKLIGMDWKMKQEWLNLPAVRRALDSAPKPTKETP